MSNDLFEVEELYRVARWAWNRRRVGEQQVEITIDGVQIAALAKVLRAAKTNPMFRWDEDG